MTFPWIDTRTIRLTASVLPVALATTLGLTPTGFAATASAQTSPRTQTDVDRSGDHRSAAVDCGKYAVVIDLDTNELHFRRGDITLWSAPVATGSALRLQSDDGSWDFSTPQGVFQVQYKELSPTWIAPDWFFIENGRPVPPPDSPERRFPGGLGAAAVYFGTDLAIHGTDKPQLLGQRVSHGCIRLENEYALRLFHNVQIGTEIVIVGGEDVKSRSVRPGESVNTFTPDEEQPLPEDPVLEGWRAMETHALLHEFDTELWLGDVAPEASRWSDVAGLLLRRGLEDDAEALRGLLSRAADLPSRHIELEYATFLADAYARGAIPTLAAMAEMDPELRDHAAEAIVEATLGLYPGKLDDRVTPWPTRRVPRSMVDAAERPSWGALSDAEREYRRRSEHKARSHFADPAPELPRQNGGSDDAPSRAAGRETWLN
jgi:L,D-transpeptidase ErfK/SrfK